MPNPELETVQVGSTEYNLRDTNAVPMVGATSQTDGTNGLVPAPTTAEIQKFLCGDGTWKQPAGSKPVEFVLTNGVTNTSGSYSHTFTTSEITSEVPPTATMKAFEIELGTPATFNATISITMNNGSITFACDDVAGSSTVKIMAMELAQSSQEPMVTSQEFDVLNGRIGNLGSLTTTDKNSAVNAINEVNASVATNASNMGTIPTGKNLQGEIDKLSNDIAIIVNGDKSTLDATKGQYLLVQNSTISGIDDGAYIAKKAITANTALDSSYFTAKSSGIANGLKGEIDTVSTNLGSPSSASGVTGADAFAKIATVDSKLTGLSDTIPFKTIVAQQTNANNVDETCMIRTENGSTNLPGSISEGVLISFIGRIYNTKVGVQYFNASNGGNNPSVYSRLCWYNTWSSWARLDNQ